MAESPQARCPPPSPRDEANSAPRQVPRGEHVVGLFRPEPGMQDDLAVVALPDREMPDAGQEPQEHWIDGHRAALAPVAHEPFEPARLDPVQPAPPLEPGGQGLPGAGVTQAEERLRPVGGPGVGAGQEARDGAKDQRPASGKGNGVAPTRRTRTARPRRSVMRSGARHQEPFRRLPGCETANGPPARGRCRCHPDGMKRKACAGTANAASALLEA